MTKTISTALNFEHTFIASKHNCSENPFWNCLFIAYKRVVNKQEERIKKMGKTISELNQKLKLK